MSKKDFIAIAYVSLWVILWGSIGSLIDYPLLKFNIYLAGSFGQISTFLITAIVSTIIAVRLFPQFKSKLED